MDESCDCSEEDERIRRILSRQASSSSKKSNRDYGECCYPGIVGPRCAANRVIPPQPPSQPSPQPRDKCGPCSGSAAGRVVAPSSAWTAASSEESTPSEAPGRSSSWKDWAPAAAGAAALMALLAFLGQRFIFPDGSRQSHRRFNSCSNRQIERQRQGCPCYRL